MQGCRQKTGRMKLLFAFAAFFPCLKMLKALFVMETIAKSPTELWVVVFFRTMESHLMLVERSSVEFVDLLIFFCPLLLAIKKKLSRSKKFFLAYLALRLYTVF